MARVGRGPHISLVRPRFFGRFGLVIHRSAKKQFSVLTSGSVATYNPDHWRGALRSGEAARLEAHHCHSDHSIR